MTEAGARIRSRRSLLLASGVPGAILLVVMAVLAQPGSDPANLIPLGLGVLGFIGLAIAFFCVARDGEEVVALVRKEHGAGIADYLDWPGAPAWRWPGYIHRAAFREEADDYLREAGRNAIAFYAIVLGLVAAIAVTELIRWLLTLV